MNEYTWEEVSRHATADSLWIVIHGIVYDVTQFKNTHPGSVGPLLHYGGKDATMAFEKVIKHMLNQGTDRYLCSMEIGQIV